MRKIILILSLLIFTFSICSAESVEQENTTKRSIVFIYDNNMGKTSPSKSSDKDIKTELQNRFVQTFSGSYAVVLGDEYLKKIKESGMMDLSIAERADIIPFFKNDNISYVVIFESLPMNSVTSSVTTTGYKGMPITIPYSNSTSYVHLKIIDVQLDKYLYNGKFSYNSTWASTSGHITKCYKDAESQVLIPKLLKQ